MIVNLGDRELAAVLAALRRWQIDLVKGIKLPQLADHFNENAPAMSADEIDDLCERINFSNRV